MIGICTRGCMSAAAPPSAPLFADVCRRVRLPAENVLGCFMWGSRLWGTAREG